jgi:hypothetical protein
MGAERVYKTRLVSAMIMVLAFTSHQPAAAFDPEKAFGNSAPSFGKIWDLFRSARDNDEQEEAISILEFAASKGLPEPCSIDLYP